MRTARIILGSVNLNYIWYASRMSKDSSGYLEDSDESVSGGYIIVEVGRTKLNQDDKRLTVNVTLP